MDLDEFRFECLINRWKGTEIFSVLDGLIPVYIQKKSH